MGVLMGRGGEAGRGSTVLCTPLCRGGLMVAWSMVTGITGFLLCRPHLDAGHHGMTMGGPGPGCPQLVQCVSNIVPAIKGDTIHCDQS